jgi:hypothetical protein
MTLPRFSATVSLLNTKECYAISSSILESEMKVIPQCNRGYMRCSQGCIDTYKEGMDECNRNPDPFLGNWCAQDVSNDMVTCEESCHNYWCTV